MSGVDRRDRVGRIAAALLACASAAHAQHSTAAAVYESVAPAVVFVETASGTGSGLLLKSDDDSGGGVFGESAELVLRADRDRTYRVVIDDAYGGGMGGYTLTIEPEEG